MFLKVTVYTTKIFWLDKHICNLHCAIIFTIHEIHKIMFMSVFIIEGVHLQGLKIKFTRPNIYIPLSQGLTKRLSKNLKLKPLRPDLSGAISEIVPCFLSLH